VICTMGILIDSFMGVNHLFIAYLEKRIASWSLEKYNHLLECIVVL
jgi:hypothetical protein